MNNLFKMSVMALLLVGSACTSEAQQNEKKIKVQISKYVEGEEKIFKGEYASEEEMLNDPAYREFAGGDDDFSFFFKGDDFDKMIKLHKGAGAGTFSFGFDDDFPPMKQLREFQFDGGKPGVFMFGDGEAMAHMRMFDSKEYEAKMEQKMKELEEKMKGLDKDLQEDIMRSMREIEEMNSSLIPHMTKRGGVTVDEVGSTDFGKRGVVEPKDKLELDDVNYMVVNKRLNVRFRLQDADELTVRISNEAGKEIYNRYFEKFNGTFDDQIDFNSYSSGKYLLEISQGKKRLTKKLVID